MIQILETLKSRSIFCWSVVFFLTFLDRCETDNKKYMMYIKF